MELMTPNECQTFKLQGNKSRHIQNFNKLGLISPTITTRWKHLRKGVVCS